MIHAKGSPKTKQKGTRNKEPTSPGMCNGSKTFDRDQPDSSCHLNVHQSVTDRCVERKVKKDAASCYEKGVGKDTDKSVKVPTDVVVRDSMPASHDDSSNGYVSSTIHLKQKQHRSSDRKHAVSNAKGTINESPAIPGSTKLPSTGNSSKSSPNGHVYSSPPKLEMEASTPGYMNAECSPPKINTKCELPAANVIDDRDTSENSSKLAELEKRNYTDDETKVAQKASDSELGTSGAEHCLDSVNPPGGNHCVDLEMTTDEQDLCPRKKTRNYRNTSLSRLIDRMKGAFSSMTSNEGVSSTNDSDESDDDESGNDVDSSSQNDDDDSDEDGDEEEDNDAENDVAVIPGGEPLCPMTNKVTCEQSGEMTCHIESKMTCPSDEQKDEPARVEPLPGGLLVGHCHADSPLPICSTANGPSTDEHVGPDSVGLRLEEDGPQAKGFPTSNLHHTSSAKIELEVMEKEGGTMVDSDAMEIVERYDSTMLSEKKTPGNIRDVSPAVHPQKKNIASTSSLTTNIGGGDAKSKVGEGGGNVYSLFEKPAPLTKKRAAAFASADLDRYLAKHTDWQQQQQQQQQQQHLAETSGKSSVCLEKKIIEVDGITFTTFPTREMLRKDVVQEKKTVRYIDTATMILQKWGSSAPKAESPPCGNESSGWQKTDDVRKIKGWKKRLLTTDNTVTPAVEVTVSCKSERLHWRSEEKLVRMLTPEQLKEMGLKLKHKRRRHTPYTQSKHHTAPDTSQSTAIVNLTDTLHNLQNGHSVNDGDTELRPAGDRHPYVIKIFGRKSDGKFAPKRRNDENKSQKRKKAYSGLLTGSPSSVEKFQTMLDRKNLSVGLSSNFCSNIETAKKFRIVDNQLIVSDAKQDSQITAAHQRIESDTNELPESLWRLQPVVLTQSMALAAVTSLQQPSRAPCKKPGCRYSCVCHLCDVVSADDGDAVDLDPVTIKTCDKEYCRLGCICDTADSASAGSIQNQGWSALDTSIDSSFDKSCSFVDSDVVSSCNTSYDAIDTKTRNSTGSVTHKRRGSRGGDRGTKTKKRCSTGDAPVIPSEGFSQELVSLLHPAATTGHVVTETTAKPEVEAPTGVRKSSRLKDKCGIGIVDRLRSLIYFDTAFWLQDDKPRKQKKNQRRQQQLAEQKQQKLPQQQQQQHQQLQYSRVKSLVRDSTVASQSDSVNMVELSSDDDEIVPQARTKRRQDSKMETDKAQASTVPSYRNFTRNLSSMHPTPSATGFATQMVVLERKPKSQSSLRRSRAEQSPSSVSPHLLEIESDCSWQNGRYKILSDIARLADSSSGYPQPVTFRVDRFVVRILSKPSEQTNIPPHLQKSLNTKQMYAVRIRITEALDGIDYSQCGISALSHLKVSLSGTIRDRLQGDVDTTEQLNISRVMDKDSDELQTFGNHWAEAGCTAVGNCESSPSTTVKAPYAPSHRSAQVEEARLALEKARRALTTELAKVKREREESFDAGTTSPVGGSVKDEESEDAIAQVEFEGEALLKSSLVRSVPSLVRRPHVTGPGSAQHPAVPVAVVQNVAHTGQLGSDVTEATGACGYDGCDDPVTEVTYGSCQDDFDTAAASSIDDLLISDDSSSLENTVGTLEYSSSSSLKSDGESCDYIDILGGGENIVNTKKRREHRKKSKMLSDCMGDRLEKNAVKVTKERVRRGQLSVKFEKLKRILQATEIPGQKLSKQVILSLAVDTVHSVSNANKRLLKWKKSESQRHVKLIERLKQLKAAETLLPRGANTSHKVLPSKRADEGNDNEIYAVSSESSDDEGSPVILS